MNPILVNCCSLALLATMYLAWILLPLTNLHLISNSEAYLQEKVQSILDESRLQPEGVEAKIADVNLDNITILGVNKIDLPDYCVYVVNYKYKWIFSNKFIGSSQLSNMTKTKTYILDRV